MKISDYNLDILANSLTINGMGPPPRVAAAVNSLREIAALPGAGEVQGEALGRALYALSMPRAQDDAATTARRDTCRHLGAALAGPENGGQIEPHDWSALPWWTAQAAYWSGETDPRRRAMAQRAQVELAELIDALR